MRRKYVFAIEALESRQFLSKTILVDVNAPGPTRDGSSWTTAYADLQAALATAVSGDQIHVADGSYAPTSSTDRTKSFQLKNGVSMVGGFAGYGSPNPDLRDVTTNVTVLSGDIGASGVSTDNSYRIVTGTGTNLSAILDGFTVAYGNANGAWPYISGAGLYNSSGSPTIRACRFLNNTANNGAAVVNNGSSPQFVDCEFSGNSAVSAGAINNVLGSSPSFLSCKFSQNVSMNAGGAVSNDTNCNPTFVDCSFESNTATLRGGAVYNINTSTPSFTDCSFSGNSVTSSSGFAGAIYNSHTVSTLLRCTFAANTSAGDAGALYADFSTPSGLDWNMTDCVFVRNSTADQGGAFYANARVRALRCAFYGNSAWSGGAATLYDHPFEFTDCIFAGNLTQAGGGAILSRNAGPLFSNCSFIPNTNVNGSGGAIYIASSTSTPALTVRNSIIWANISPDSPAIYKTSFSPSAVVTYSDVQAITPGTGNLNLDPLLRRMPTPGNDNLWATPDDDYGNLHLQSGSSCIDTGDNASVPSGITGDFDGNSRIIDIPGAHDPGPIVDLGAYEKTLPLTVTSSSFTPGTMQPSLSFVFSSAVQQSSLAGGDLSLFDETIEQALNTQNMQVNYDSSAFTVTWMLPLLPEGNYKATLPADAVNDSSDDGLSASYTTNFFILSADGDRNRTVDILDFNILATNFGKAGQTFSQGNYDYSADGQVNILDFNVLATNFGKHLDPPPPPPTTQPLDQPASFTIGQRASISQRFELTEDRNLLVDSGLM
jgi:predicted outer membrane repeat protein